MARLEVMMIVADFAGDVDDEHDAAELALELDRLREVCGVKRMEWTIDERGCDVSIGHTNGGRGTTWVGVPR